VKSFANRSQTLVLTGATLPTLEYVADTLIIRKNKISEIGLWRNLKAHLPSQSVIKDLSGATILPGLGDAHVHFAATGFLETALDCSQVKTVNELLEFVHKAAQTKDPRQLILGFRLQTLNDRFPTLTELTGAAPNHLVYIRHITGHGSFVNKATLEWLGFSTDRPGVVLNEQDEPTGYLIAQATQIATQKIYALNAAQVGYANAFLAGAKRAVSKGCTVLHALDDLQAVEALLEVEVELPLRVLPYAQSFDIDAVEALGIKRIGGCHGSALDGDFDMYTAALSSAYQGFPNRLGMLYQETDFLEDFVLRAHQRGFQCAFHAVGDRAVEQALGAYEKAQAQFLRPNARHRIEHAQMIQESHIERIKNADVVMSLQPAFNYLWNHKTYLEWIDKDRARNVDPLRTWQEAGIPIAGGSDSTVTELAPMLGIHSAVNHSRKDQRISLAKAIEMFSSGVAYSSHHETVRGKLEAGHDADLTILAQNPFELDPTKIKDAQVIMTLVNGNIVFEI
jgi:predicted amidohydrolase YtcJ